MVTGTTGSATGAPCFVGVDVGTGSARAGIFDTAGVLLGTAKHDIPLYREGSHIVEQSSAKIWHAVCRSVQGALQAAGLSADHIGGIGFDATCSLVVLDQTGNPLPVGPSEDPDRDVIVWMDHRAIPQAAHINSLKHPVLDYVGGHISPEMQTPKLLWLKENRPEIFKGAGAFFDLTDFLTWRATGNDARSVCTVTCKWTYLAHEKRWDASYFRAIGLGELADEDFSRIGTTILDAGAPVGDGLSEKAAAELGLRAGIPVGAGLIDAHAGGIGTVGAEAEGEGPAQRMAYVFGTSACTLSSSVEPSFVPGVWGPYASAMVPGLWLNEGGQSAAGAAIAHLLKMHPMSAEANAEARTAGKSLPAWLIDRILERVNNLSEAPLLAGEIMVVPEFLGNRAPHADPDARAIIAGLDLNDGLESLIGLYVAGLCGLGYGLRQILRAQAEAGLTVDTIVISGGAGESDLVRQVLADSCGLRIRAAGTAEPVLLGSAILAAVASGHQPDLVTAMRRMSVLGNAYNPSAPSAAWHDRRFAMFEGFQNLYRSSVP
ncbi:FGGY-family carbohydrate kinase [Agrobacterium tumefaciens]|nr:FGGY-family carbohydrate kinase [Agrobacterium tumefaciens]